MARYKPVDLSPRFLAVDLEKQRLRGSFSMPDITSWRTTSICRVLTPATATTPPAPRPTRRGCCSRSSCAAIPPPPLHHPSRLRLRSGRRRCPPPGERRSTGCTSFGRVSPSFTDYQTCSSVRRAAKNPGCTEMTQPVLPKGPIRCLPVSRYQYCEQQINGGLLEPPDHGVPRCNRFH